MYQKVIPHSTPKNFLNSWNTVWNHKFRKITKLTLNELFYMLRVYKCHTGWKWGFTLDQWPKRTQTLPTWSLWQQPTHTQTHDDVQALPKLLDTARTQRLSGKMQLSEHIKTTELCVCVCAPLCVYVSTHSTGPTAHAPVYTHVHTHVSRRLTATVTRLLAFPALRGHGPHGEQRKDGHVLFYGSKSTCPFLCINQTSLRLASANRLITTLSNSGEKEIS